MTREILHIGFPKAGSTTLQEHLFGRHPEIRNVAMPFRDERHQSLCTALALSDDIDYPEDELSALIASYRKERPKVLLYSDETVVNTQIRSIAAKRLKRLFPKATILAVLRNQIEAFASDYANRGRRLRPAPEPFSGRHVSFENYLAFHHAKPKRGFLTTLSYDVILDVYDQLFGRDRIHVLLFEEFVQDRPAFVARLAEILEVDAASVLELLHDRHEHKRTSESVARYQALRSRFLWGVPLSRIIPGSRYIKQALFRAWGDQATKVEYPGDWRGKIADLFRPGNRAVQEKFGVPLDRFGYPV